MVVVLMIEFVQMKISAREWEIHVYWSLMRAMKLKFSTLNTIKKIIPFFMHDEK